MFLKGRLSLEASSKTGLAVDLFIFEKEILKKDAITDCSSVEKYTYLKP